MKSNTYNDEFKKLNSNEKAIVSYIINMYRGDDNPTKIATIEEEGSIEAVDDNVLDHLHKIADGYMGIKVNFNKRRTHSGEKREELKENSISFKL